MTTTDAANDSIDYGLQWPGTPAVGDRVRFDRPHDGHDGGRVVGTLAGVLGRMLVVEIAPGRRVDVYWQRCRAVAGA